MKQAIILMIYSFKNNVCNLLKEFDSEYFDIFIHIDKISNISQNDLNNVCTKSKVYIYKKINVHWGGTSQMKCELYMFNKIMESKENYSYIHILSGEDFPLVTNECLFNFFKNSKYIFLEDFERLPSSEEYKLKYFFYSPYLFKNRKFIRRVSKISLIFQKILHINRKSKIKYKNFKCGQWCSLPSNAVQYLVKNQKEINKHYSFTFCGDECFIATYLAINIEFKDLIYKNNIRLIDWKRGYPYLFSKDDINEINDSNMIFARKVNLSMNNLPLLIKRRDRV